MASELSEVESFTINSMIREYYIYNDVWSGAVLHAAVTPVRNYHDPFALAISIN